MRVVVYTCSYYLADFSLRQYAYRIKVKHWALLSPANSKIVEIFENKIVKVATIDKSSGKEVY